MLEVKHFVYLTILHCGKGVYVCAYIFQILKSLMCIVCIIQSMIGAETTPQSEEVSCLKSQRRLVFVTLSFVIERFQNSYSKPGAIVL